MRATESLSEEPGHRWYQFSLRRLLLFMTVSALVCVWLAKCIEVQKEKTKKLLSPVTSQADWPTEIHDFVKDASHRNISVQQIKVHYVVRWGDEYCWQTAFSTEVLGLMTSRWALSPVTREHGAVRTFVRHIVDERKLVGQADEFEFFGSPNLVAGEKGDRYLVMRDKSKGLLIIRYYFNF